MEVGKRGIEVSKLSDIKRCQEMTSHNYGTCVKLEKTTSLYKKIQLMHIRKGNDDTLTVGKDNWKT